MLTLPPLVSNFIIDTDSESESEDDSMPETPPALAPVLPAFLTKPPPSVIALGPNQRAIAGSQRVYRFREMQGVHIGKGGGEVLQSITAAPALGHNSFEVGYNVLLLFPPSHTTFAFRKIPFPIFSM